MTNQSDNIKAKLQKILALTVSDKEHERSAAKEMLDRLLNKHNLTMSDICDEATMEFKFYFTSGLEKQLIIQLVALDNPKGSYYTRKGERHIILDLTKVNGIDLQYKYNIYRAALKVHVKEVFHAFLLTNSLLTPAGDDAKPLTPKERAELIRIMAKAQFMDKTQIHKALDHKGT